MSQHVILTLNKLMLTDFEKFKKDNELLYCTCKQAKHHNNSIEVVWTSTRKYTEFDTTKILKDFENYLADNNFQNNATISKVTCQDSIYIVEYSVAKEYHTR